jgi:hypothetical protein
VPRDLFQKILSAIAALRPLPPPPLNARLMPSLPGCLQEICIPMLASGSESPSFRRSSREWKGLWWASRRF